MQFKNTVDRFGIIAIIFHWIMAILIIGLLILGLYMVRMPISLEKLKFYGWHKEYGLLVLALVALRLGWRLGNVNPSLAELPWYERLPARAVHWLFYFCMIAMPLTGWCITSAAGLAPSFFGLFVLPALIPANDNQLHLFEFIHQWLAYGLIALICLHTAAALKHHFVDKDTILRRMI